MMTSFTAAIQKSVGSHCMSQNSRKSEQVLGKTKQRSNNSAGGETTKTKVTTLLPCSSPIRQQAAFLSLHQQWEINSRDPSNKMNV